MGSQRRAIWTGANGIQASWCFMLLAAVPWSAVANTEVDALNALREALTDPFQVLESWDPSSINPCLWYHVTCSAQNSVIRIDLGYAGLSGPLVSELGELSQLQYLEMYSNNLSGAIPSSLGNLTKLVSLDLYENIFIGEIPVELGSLSKLQFLRLDNNHLTGPIPESLTGLDNLQVLDLSNNTLSGDIPVTGVFANFTYKSFEGNPGLHYPALLFAPAPSSIVPAPTSGL